MADAMEMAEQRRLPDVASRALLARAAELDSRASDELSVAQLRLIALESGIGAGAFESALSELRPSAPWWVRLGMTGVPDRRAATVYYWVVFAILCLSPVIARTVGPLASRRWGAATIVVMACSCLALWGTSRAIRWLDRHGWDRLG